MLDTVYFVYDDVLCTNQEYNDVLFCSDLILSTYAHL